MATTTEFAQDLPPQRKTSAEKTQDWKEKSVDAIIGLSTFARDHFGYKTDVSKSYGYYAGNIEDEDYSHVLRPYGKLRKNMPAKLQNYNIIKPSVDLLLGEKAKRPYNYVVKVSNPDISTKKEQALQKELSDNLMQQFLNELRASGMSDEEIQEVPPTEDIAEAFEKDYIDERALIGQASLQYMADNLELPRKFRDAFFHFLVSGRVVTEKFVSSNRIDYRVGNPLDYDWDKSPDTVFIEDGEWALGRTLATVADVLDLYYDDLTPAQITTLEARAGSGSQGNLWNTDSDNNLHTNNADNQSGRHNVWNNRFIEVYRTYWKSMTRIGIRRYQDAAGSWEKEVVDDTYQPGPDENIEWHWVNQVWQGVRLADDIYLNIEPFEPQRRSKDNYSVCKLPINGRKYSDINSRPISLVMLGIPYQLLYNVYHYRLELAIAKAKDMIAHFDFNSIPSGWDVDKWLYYIDALGFAFSSGPKDGEPVASAQHKSVLDLSAKNIDQYINLLGMIQTQWDDLAGISRQRKGLTSPYELKSTTEQSIIQSSFITEDIFMKARELEERELEGLLDLSKVAWMNNIIGSYVMPDKTVGILEVDGIEHSETEYGIHVVSSGEEGEKVQFMHALLQQAAGQGTMPMSMIAEILNAPSFAAIKDKIEDAEATQQKLAEEQQKMEQEQQQQAMQLEQEKMAFEKEEGNLNRQNLIDVAVIQAASKQGGEGGGGDVDNDGVPDIVQAMGDTEDTVRKIVSDERKQDKELAFKREDLKEKVRHNKEAEATQKISAKRKPSGA